MLATAPRASRYLNDPEAPSITPGLLAFRGVTMTTTDMLDTPMTCCNASPTTCNAAWAATGDPCCALCTHWPQEGQ